MDAGYTEDEAFNLIELVMVTGPNTVPSFSPVIADDMVLEAMSPDISIVNRLASSKTSEALTRAKTSEAGQQYGFTSVPYNEHFEEESENTLTSWDGKLPIAEPVPVNDTQRGYISNIRSKKRTHWIEPQGHILW